MTITREEQIESAISGHLANIAKAHKRGDKEAVKAFNRAIRNLKKDLARERDRLSRQQ